MANEAVAGANAHTGSARDGDGGLYTMKQACEATGLPYETLKFYCNEGLVPNVKRDRNNRRVFDERDIRWIGDLSCLKGCGMGIKDMKEYLALCLQGASTIPQRKEMLARHRAELVARIEELQGCVDYIDWKQGFYDEVLAGTRPYVSNLIAV